MNNIKSTLERSPDLFPSGWHLWDLVGGVSLLKQVETMKTKKRPTATDAVSCARQFGYPWMVCEMDHEDGRKQYLRPLRYADDPEFEAFDGQILAIGNPDGSVE